MTGVCSTRNAELARCLGANRVVDYEKDDFTRGGQRYDVLKVKPVIDRTFPLSEIAAALNYLGEGHARGKIAITV